MTITGDRFLEGLKRRVTVPANQVLIGDSGFFQLSQDVTRDKMVSLLLSINQNYFVYEDTDPLVAEQAAYDIPYRSIGRTLRDLKLRNVSDTSSIRDMALIALEDAHMFPSSGDPTGFYFRGDKIVLVSTPTSTGWELLRYYDLQPSQLVKTTDAALITGISSNVVTCSSVPTTMLSAVDVDFVKGRQGCSTVGMDVAISSVAGNQITFASAGVLPDNLSVGDYIALAQQTPVLQLPDEAHPLLETLTAARICHAIGDFDGASVLKEEAKEQQRDLLKLLSPRIEGEPTKIVNRRGLLRGQGFRSWRSTGGRIE